MDRYSKIAERVAVGPVTKSGVQLSIGKVMTVWNPNYNRYRPSPDDPEKVLARVTDFGEKHGQDIVDFEREDGKGMSPMFWVYLDEL